MSAMPDVELTDTDSEVLFDLMERLTQRGYRVQVTITLPSGGRLTLDGRPGTPVGFCPPSARSPVTITRITTGSTPTPEGSMAPDGH